MIKTLEINRQKKAKNIIRYCKREDKKRMYLQWRVKNTQLARFDFTMYVPDPEPENRAAFIMRFYSKIKP